MGMSCAPIMISPVQSLQGPVMPDIVTSRVATHQKSRFAPRRQAGAIRGVVVLALVLLGLVASLVIGFGLFGIVLRLFMR
jgi:hypothetical protein